MHSSVLFKKNQNIPCSLAKARPQKGEARIWARQSLFPETWRIRTGTGHSQKRRRCATAWVVFKSMIHINDKHIFWPQKIALLCFLASDAWKVLSCLACTCIACRENWKVPAPDAAANQTALYKKEPLEKTKPREYRSSILLQTWNGRERQRARAWLVPWRCKSSRKESRQNGSKEPLARGCAQCCRGRQKIPRDWDDFTHKHYFQWCLLNLDKYFKNVLNLTSSLFSFF